LLECLTLIDRYALMDGVDSVRRIWSIGHTGPDRRALCDGCGYKWDTLATDPGMVHANAGDDLA